MKKNIFCATMLMSYGLIYAAAESTSMITGTGCTTPYVSTVHRLKGDDALSMHVKPKLFGFKEQCLIGVVDTNVVCEFPYPLEDAFYDAQAMTASQEEVRKVLSNFTEKQPDVLIAILHQAHMFVCHKGTKTKALVIMRDESPTWEVTALNDSGQPVTHIQQMPEYLAAAFLAGVNLQNERVAEIVKSVLAQSNKNTLDAANAVLAEDMSEGKKAVGILDFSKWSTEVATAIGDDVASYDLKISSQPIVRPSKGRCDLL